MALPHDIAAALKTPGEINAIRDLVALSQKPSFDPEEMQNRVIYVHTPGLPNQAMEVTLTPIRIRCPVSLLQMCAQNIRDTWFKNAEDITLPDIDQHHTLLDLITELGEDITLSDTDTLDFHSVYTCKQLVKEIEYQPFHVKEKAYKMGKAASILFGRLKDRNA